MNIFITGASSGIGEALAHEYAKQSSLMRGANSMPESRTVIGLAARRIEPLQKLAADLHAQYQVTCAIYPLDVRNSAALQAAAADFIQNFGAPNIVIANAGVSRGTLTEHKEDISAFQAVMDINVMGMVHTFQPFIASMKAAGQGQLVGVASVAGIRGLPGAGAYSASKAAAISYLESLRVEMVRDNIAVTTIAPGYIRTPMTAVNDYKMPFLMDSDVFAHKFAGAVKNKRRFVVIPWQMGIVARLMRLIPPFLWDLAMKKAPHKKRIDWDWL
ncbi:MAG: SDR family oxidoreductase [Methylotenera sp.]|nr:SDR family oxidoreductase [Methylotenera sp.]